ncbi:hypothetical protein ES703_53140 [subsurface metagenome]
MVVPLREHRHIGVEGAEVLIEPVVFVVGAEFVEAVRNDGFLFGHDIAPDLAARQLQLALDRTIRIDVVAAMDEEVGTVVQHRAIGAIAAARGIDAPALPGGVAGPQEGYRAALGRRGAETSDLHIAGVASIMLFEAHAVEDVLSCRQAVDQEFRGEIVFRECVDSGGADDAGKALCCRTLHPHSRRPVGARPDHGGVGRDIAGLNP